MRSKLLVLGMTLLAFLFMSNSGCQPADNKQVSDSGAKQVSFEFKIPVNALGHTVEQENIFKRLRVTTDPTKILWIHLIALDGKIIRRMPLVAKVTSSGKRLEPRHVADSYNTSYPKAGIGSWETDEFIQPDGTYGDSDPYIYWFDPTDRYHQWGTAGGLGYLLTDYPIDLANPMDEITGLYNVHKAASAWQKEQEQKLVVSEKTKKIDWEKEMKVLEEKTKQDSTKNN
jgi:hypothetical protein